MESSQPIESDYDCIVIGAGPAGCTAAAFIADAGYRVLLLERERVPREHIGESLMPETYWVFERLGVLEKMYAAPFVRKVGVQFVNNTGKESQPFLFRMHDPRPSSWTWHVERAQFDQMLFEHAAEKGATCRDGVRVLDVEFDGDRATGVVIASADGGNGRAAEGAGADSRLRQRVSARVIVDASGQQGLISGKLGLRQVLPGLKKAAIWAHFRGARRDVANGGVNTIVLHTRSRQAWFWYIPQSEDIVSVGVVGDNDYLLKGRGTPEEIFAEQVKQCDGIAERIAGAERVDPIQVSKEYSYTTRRSAGDGWVLVGDAWGFIDPLYSSGVYFALKSAELASDCVIEGLKKGDTSAAQLGAWLPDFATATKWVRELVLAYYTNCFRVGKFVTEYPEHKGNLTDLLIGRIFGPGVGRIFDDLKPWLQRMEAEMAERAGDSR